MTAKTVEGIDVLSGPEEDFFTPPVVEVKPVDPEMESGNPRWNPRKYFGAQKQVLVLIQKDTSDLFSDPSGKNPVIVPVSINGFRINVQKGVPTRVPEDFARHLVDIGAAIQYAE